MKYLSGISKLFLAAGIVLLAIWLLLHGRGCNSPSHDIDAQYVQEQQRLRDSSANVLRIKEVAHKADSTRQKHALDSINIQLSAIRKLLNKSQQTAADLAAGVDIAKLNHDTLGYVSKCDSLADEVVNLNGVVDSYKMVNDALAVANDKLQKTADARLLEHQQFISDIRHGCDSTTTLYYDLLKDYKKITKKVEKKYAIGLGVGIGITSDGKPGGLIGITISRNLIRL
ncbi:MAG TPA: hypothetical protein VMZ03_03930 [Chitinophagaceae bacterium]|nr:hypothetical protein [Chitinophagaceae bacterium]